MGNKSYCINCRFWFPVSALSGQCRRRAPTRDLEDRSHWPCTTPNQVCGEHEPVCPAVTAKRKAAIVTTLNVPEPAEIPEEGIDLGEI